MASDVVHVAQNLYNLPFLTFVAVVLSAQIAKSILPVTKKRHSSLIVFFSMVLLAFLFYPLVEWVIREVFELVVSSYGWALVVVLFGSGIYLISNKGNEK